MFLAVHHISWMWCWWIGWENVWKVSTRSIINARHAALFRVVCPWLLVMFISPGVHVDVSFLLLSTTQQHLSSSREHTGTVQPLPSSEPHADLHCQRRQTRTIGKSLVNLLYTHITNHIGVILNPFFPQVNSEVHNGALLNAGAKDPVH